MASTNGFTVRSARAEERAEIIRLSEIAFGMRVNPADTEYGTQVFPTDRALVAVDGDQIVGHANDRVMTVTVPGERTIQASGVTSVVVAPTHRRRGILRALYTELHRRSESEGLPLTIFTASEGTIYGRFGYGPTVVANEVSIRGRKAEFRSTTPDPGGVRMATREQAEAVLPEIYDRWRRLVPGAQIRPEARWQQRVFADAVQSEGGSPLFFLVHPDGYAVFRRAWSDEGKNTASIHELRAVTPEAHIALWRVLLSMDLVDSIEAELTDHDPLPYLVTNPRLVKTTGRHDALWARIMDVPAALTARTYQRDLDVVLSVDDPFRDAGGSFALRIRDGIAECERTDRTPDLALGIDVLGSIYFGAYRARVFAAANRVQVKDPAGLRAFDEAFASDRDAELGCFF
ncbi:GNAT family N-acetyltransferase [Nocardia seriolae]|uniref:Enhanced intracellular survival protein n=1 Tax=Nocardia seriolae TaxID=37332 RepID=A0ABC8B6E3_9NOCA|nr:GNAT family N-acetyltransferase [Nocardia seriolae]APB01800.1 Enhanced intracellular survival protein [Nocardia seriolae]MTJ60742.1 GNAT family N-acetyltransferase [Nocardia seriolae]MTJ70319.1 GNAT family N-acetyltransferase [Nocardia seriolae]MTJ91113.1 GNAT family N-acetyltransferase [Nocardia seriolae]MTK35075.1 GNAT family N-acetyltransferase [Nocardia seriolae]